VKASYNSIRGKIASEWRRDGGKFTLKISIPANTTATVYVPAAWAASVKVNSLNAKFLREENSCEVFAAGSGDYTFESQ
jgi:alpha-L-rhamnosidase